jgi:hypothetical protein
VNAARLRECCDIIGWPLRQLTRELNQHGWRIADTTVRQGWARDLVPIPDDVAEWLERLADCHQANPPPPRTYGKTEK